MRDNSSVLFLVVILYAFDKRSLFKYKFGEISSDSRKPEMWHFDGLLLSKSYTVPAKKVQESYLS